MARGVLAAMAVVTVTAAFKSVQRPQAEILVTFYMGTECPLTQAYTSRINALVKEFSDEGVSFTGLFPQASDDASKVAAFTKERGFAFPCQTDPAGKDARSERIEVVPTVVVRHVMGRELYRGAIDDNKVLDHVKTSYLRDALRAVVSGRPVPLRSTTPQGCVFSPDEEAPPMIKATYADAVARILNDHCVTCHRPGQVAPFSLIGYENAKNWAPTIAAVTAQKRMPPWKAVEGIGDFEHENRLTADEIALLAAWAEAKAPRGDAAKEPSPPKFPADWPLGEPDMTVQMPKPFKVAADGNDEYWHFVLKPDLKAPTYVQAIDVRPGNKRIVHHVILWLDEKGAADKVLATKGVDGGYMTFGSPGFVPDNSLGGWAPGLMPTRMPEDAGILLKPGTNVVLEVHYHKSGKEETDQTKVGLYFAKDATKVKNKVEIAWLANLGIRIKPDLADQKFTQTIPIPVAVKLYSLMPHMHLLGRKMKATLIKPDKTEEPLIAIDDWDFNWQFTYALKTPKVLPAGSKVRIEAVFDNSSGNPNNPNEPPKEVRWGEQTTDEMMLLVAAISIPDNPLDKLRERAAASRSRRDGGGR
ncbi:MAG: redoxin domain-containing protein [Armatimonadetes bacterium]|nr:redoxin domain-containing protein [Armatimonadota bacterium]